MQDHIPMQILKRRTKLPHIAPHNPHSHSPSPHPRALLSNGVIETIISRQLDDQVDRLLVTEAAVEREEVGVVEEQIDFDLS